VQRGLIFDLRRYSIHDGPGIRTTVFFQGCPLSCWWCHNPESQARVPFVHWRGERCLTCGSCAAVCPEEAITVGEGEIATDPLRCHSCGRCTDVCPALARELVGRPRSVEEIVAEVEKDQPFYERSGGGVTFSGGEPLLQWRFLLALLLACGERGLHRAVDTSGVARRDVLLEIAEHTDLFLYDLKTLDPLRHVETTGVRNGRIIDNLRALAETGVEIWIRVPLVPGVNDDDENLDRTARFVRRLPGITRVSLLPFHASARDKHDRFGMPWRLGDVEPLAEARVQELAERVAAHGLDVHVGG
jgi:pyruvate formate lyase activating enzyme